MMNDVKNENKLMRKLTVNISRFFFAAFYAFHFMLIIIISSSAADSRRKTRTLNLIDK